MGAMRTLAMLAVLLCACAPAAEAAGCTSQMMLQFSRASQEYAACIQRKPADVMGAGSSFCKCASAYVSGLRELAQHCATAKKTMDETVASTRDICAPAKVDTKRRRLDGHTPSSSYTGGATHGSSYTPTAGGAASGHDPSSSYTGAPVAGDATNAADATTSSAGFGGAANTDPATGAGSLPQGTAGGSGGGKDTHSYVTGGSMPYDTTGSMPPHDNTMGGSGGGKDTHSYVTGGSMPYDTTGSMPPHDNTMGGSGGGKDTHSYGTGSVSESYNMGYGSHYSGSHYGSTGGVVGSHGGQYSDTVTHDQLPGEHSAPKCLHNCFVHYAWKENLPRGEEPRCNLWSQYLFGDGCKEAHLKPTCEGPDMNDVLLKCIDTGCDWRKCMGDTIEGEDRVKSHLQGNPGKCNKLKYVQQVHSEEDSTGSKKPSCKQLERACNEEVRGAGSEFEKLRAAFCGKPAIAASNNTAFAPAAPGTCEQFSTCVKDALSATGCLHDTEPLAQGWMDFHKTEQAVCRYDPHKKQGPCRDLCQDEYRHKFMLPENETVTNKCDYYRDFVFGHHRPAPCHATDYNAYLGSSHGTDHTQHSSYEGSPHPTQGGSSGSHAMSLHPTQGGSSMMSSHSTHGGSYSDGGSQGGVRGPY